MKYGIHFACLECQKSFKREYDYGSGAKQLPCPNCTKPSFNFGRHFLTSRTSRLLERPY